jgi:beta-mannosidase
MDYHGEELFHSRMERTVRANSSDIMMRIDKSTLDRYDLKNALLFVCAQEGDRLLDESFFLFDSPKNLPAVRPLVTYRLEPTHKGYNITLQTDVFAQKVYLRSDVDGFFSDNYFDLLPGREKVVYFRTEESVSEDNVSVMNLADSHGREP